MNLIFPGGAPTIPGVIIAVAGVMLVAAAALTLIRMAKGPGTLDRVVAADVLIATLIAGIALESALRRNLTTIPVILVIALLGFAGSLSVARFAAGRDKAVKLVPTEESGPGGNWPGKHEPGGAQAPRTQEGRVDDDR